nr:hypothetical protein Iba_chr09dCG12460 [Ipomoea batatas]
MAEMTRGRRSGSVVQIPAVLVEDDENLDGIVAKMAVTERGAGDGGEWRTRIVTNNGFSGDFSSGCYRFAVVHRRRSQLPPPKYETSQWRRSFIVMEYFHAFATDQEKAVRAR